ncbi:MAG: hypothetical protein ABL929_00005, partial [Ferruginibacter sp.]
LKLLEKAVNRLEGDKKKLAATRIKLLSKFLQKYIGISNGSIYNASKLKDVDRKIAELPFAETQQNSFLNMLNTSATLILNVKSKKSSEASAILGFLPNANGEKKLQVTGDVNIDLKNVFGAGEGLLLKYQALQPQSPRVNIGFEKPYIFHSSFGLSFLFELFKKDSSFLQINTQAALHLNLASYQKGKILIQWQTTNLLQGGVDTNVVKQQKKLPSIIDVKSTNVGVIYEYQKTNYKFNPIKGNEISLTAFAGIKNIIRNSDIVAINPSAFNYSSLYDSIRLRNYQIKMKLTASHYFKIAKASTLKTALNFGIYSSPTIFRNEVFQIGGYKLLRGFDEESIYATQYATFTTEYRVLTGLNSHIFAFVDAGFTKAKYQNFNTNNFFIAPGLGILQETKAGLLNLSIAIGKRNDIPFNIKQSTKIHFGYINYF